MMTYINTLLFVFTVYFTGCVSGKPSKCVALKPISSIMLRGISEDPFPIEYNCPRRGDPENYTDCCENEKCCEPSFFSKALSDDWLMLTAILVICSCVILKALVIICCFWSKCPLYNTCRANYNTTNVIVYSLGKDDPTPLMPAEGNKGGPYHPCTVKIKKMQEV